MKFSRLLCGLSCLLMACENPLQQDSTNDVTHVEHSTVKRQSIGNCWLYAQASWLESMLKITQSPETNVAESYWTYWDLYEKLLRHTESSEEGLNTGGTWARSTQIIRTYGWIEEAAFIPDEAEDTMSDAQACAETYLTREVLPGGSLDPNLPRSSLRIKEELNKAFSCQGRYKIDMDAAYSKRHLAHETMLKDPKTGREQSLDRWMNDWNDIGNPAFNYWSSYEGKKLPDADAKNSFRNIEARIKKALNDHQPVVLSFYVSFNAPDEKGLFNLSSLAAKGSLGRSGGHMLVLHDYVVEDVPGVGRLDEGEMDEAAKALALLGKLNYVVAKNSWGSDREDRPWIGNGFSRISWDYLTKTYYDEESESFRPFLQGLVFPPGY